MQFKNVLYMILVVSQVIFCIISYLPQIIQLIKTKKSEDISIPTYVLLTLSFVDYAFILAMDGVGLMVTLLNIFELSLCFITTVLVVKYKHKSKALKIENETLSDVIDEHNKEAIESDKKYWNYETVIEVNNSKYWELE